MGHIFIINICRKTVRPMFSGFQQAPQRIGFFDTVVGVELRLVG